MTRAMRALAVLVLSAASLAPAVPARAAPGCRLEPGRPEVTGEPWAQQVLSVAAAHRVSTGRGVVVAVVDSGVDFRHPQLKGAAAGAAIDLTKTGDADCAGHGTGVAGIIAARSLPKVPFVGVAPDARLLSVKIADRDQGNSDKRLALGIVAAVRRGAKVINVSAQTPYDTPSLKQAVAYALRQDVVVVAAAGNVDPEDTGKARPVYPAQYPGVLSVTAVASDRKITEFADPATRVSVAAPGEAIVSTWPGGGWNFDYQGTSFAAPFVSGVAALIRSAHPALTAPEVARRIETTTTSPGLIDPLQAVTAILPAPPVSATPRDVALPSPPPPNTRTRTIALTITATALGGTLLALALAVALPRGRTRHWRAPSR
ncbi:type VII secretion-associated serine protease mycosin [Actinocorallia lasiicapitis]